MGEEDVARQRPNVFWMEKLGATVIPVTDGSRTLKDAMNEAFRDWVTSMDDTHYVIGTICGPHPFPEMVAWFQSIIGHRSKRADPVAAARSPAGSCVCLCRRRIQCHGDFSGVSRCTRGGTDWCRSRGLGIDTGQHAARMVPGCGASAGVAQGYKTMFLQSPEGQMLDTHSIAAGLDYVGVSPMLAHLGEQGRVRFESATDTEVMAALSLAMRAEGLIPAMESAHAFVQAIKEAPALSPDQALIINMSGRGDKDIFTIAHAFDDPSWKEFIVKRAEAYR
jgi:tryptophan synthase beta chain